MYQDPDRRPYLGSTRPLGPRIHTRSSSVSYLSSRSSSSHGIKVAALAGIIVLCLVLSCLRQLYLGIGGMGPERTQIITVERTYVDVSGSGDDKESHYMVVTDRGIFEVNNGWTLGIFNADEIFGKLVNGKRFCATSKGNQVVNAFYQEYPYIVAVVEAKEDWGQDSDCPPRQL